MRSRKFVAFALAVAVSSWAGAASAATIFIGVSDMPTTPVTIGTGSSASPVGIAAFGSAGGIAFSAVGHGVGDPTVTPPILLSGFSIDSSTSAGGNAYLFISETNLTGPLGSQTFTSAITSLLLPAGWTETVTSYFDQSNTPYGMATLLSTLNLSGPCPVCSSQVGTASVANISAPYSITEVLHLIAPGQGTSTESLAISAVPGPIVGAGLPGLIAACGGLLALARRRRKEAA